MTAPVTTVTGGSSPGAAAGAADAAGAAAERRAAMLRISPDRFVGGQALTFVGVLPGAANDQLKLQRRFDRPGDAWVTLPGVVGTTGATGAFSFVAEAPSNYGVGYRVKAVGGPAGAAVRLEPRQQELALSLNGAPAQQPGRVVAGRPFRIDVDTTVAGRGEVARPAPAYPGRTLALQQRVDGNRWATVDSAAASAEGRARFVVTAGQPGATAYRVRQAAITVGGDDIGWFPSYPLAVRVVAPGSRVEPDVAPARTATSAAARPPATSLTPSPVTRASGAPQAGQRYRWGPTLWDFAWENGESLTERPARGQQRTGRWIDRSDGSGRAAPYNGGMALSSNLSELPGRGDRGTTSATLAGNALTYGRWEFRRRIDVFEQRGRDYRVRIDLVPERAEDAGCGAITVANVSYDARTATLGLSSARAGRSWSGTRSIARLGDRPHSFGVEVTRSHVTWFLDGRSLATVRSPQAAPGVPLTPRLSLVGDGGKEMRRTRVLYDWQRGWRLNKQAVSAPKGPGLQAKNYPKSC